MMCILLLAFGVKASTSTLNPRWAQMGLCVLASHDLRAADLDRPDYVPPQAPGYKVMAAAATALEIVWRLLLWSFCFYVYVQLCWRACTLTSFEVVWRAVFPAAALFLICAQCITIRIHVLLAIKAVKQRSSDPDYKILGKKVCWHALILK